MKILSAEEIKKAQKRNYFSKSPIMLLTNFFRSKKIDRRLKLATVLGIIFVMALLSFDWNLAKAGPLVLGPTDIKEGYSEYGKINNIDGTGISLQNGDLGSWTNDDQAPIDVPDTPSSPDMIYGLSNTIYMLTGNTSGRFLRYWVEERRWESLAPLPFANFSRLTFDGSRYFYTTATSGFNFFRYDSFTNTWERLPDTPGELMSGASVEYTSAAGGTVYVLRGGNTGFFWRFSILNWQWEELPSSIFSFTTGSSMMWDRGDFLYSVKGNYTYRLYRYQISTGQWVDRGYFHPRIYDISRTKMIYLNTNEFYLMSYNSTMAKYNALTNTFSDVPYAVRPNQESLAGAYDGVSKFYAMLGGYDYGTGNLHVMDTGTGIWDYGQIQTVLPTNYTAWAYDGADNVYAITSSSSTYRQNLATGVGTFLSPPTSYGLYVYPSAVYSSDKIYLTKGYSYQNFFLYDVASGEWQPELASIPDILGAGSTLVDGGDGYLYLSRGRSTSTFYRYKIDDPDGDVWSTINAIPFSMDLGGSIVKVGNFIYAFSGTDSGNARMAYFDLTLQTWTEDTASVMPVGWPYGPRFGSDGVSKIYFLSGSNGTDLSSARRFYTYDINTKVWKRLSDLPDYARGNSRPYVFVRNGEVYASKGTYDTRLWKWTSSAAAYKTDGTWYSKHYDLTQAATFGNLDFNTVGSGSVMVSTRSSSDGAVWNNWITLNGNAIRSDPHRYFQFKVALQGDGTATPTVSNFSVAYTQETAPPSLPSTFKAYATEGGAELTTGATYPHHHPYFTWSGADDGLNGSGVVGYYVYFGTDSNADPLVSGNYQTETNYTADIPMTAGDIDYFKIKVKDKLGNISDSGPPFFSYRYWFVSPPSSVSVATNSDFAQGTGQGLDLSAVDGTATLVGRPDGTWLDGDLAKIPQWFKGGAAAYAQNSLYMVMGNGTKFFYRYDLSANQWVSLADTLTVAANSPSGGVLCYDGSDYIYFITTGSTAFAKYSISRNAWTALVGLPTPAGAESAMAPITNGKFIVSLGYTTINFLYDPALDDFSENTPCPGNFSTATNFYFDGADTVYTMTEYDWLRKFVISENRWYSLLQAPIHFMDAQNVAFDGIGDNLYFYGQRNAYPYFAARYSISEKRFYYITSPPYELNTASYVVSDHTRYVFIFQNAYDGSRQDNIFFRYDTLNDTYTPDLYSPKRTGYFDRSSGTGGTNYGIENGWPFYSNDWTSSTYDGSDTVFIKSHSHLSEYSISQKKVTRETRMIYANYGSIYYLNGYVYSTVSNGSKRLFRFNVSTSEWEELANAPGNISLIYSQNLFADKEGRLYAAVGAGTKTVYRYTPGVNTWETLALAPIAINDGYTFAYDGNHTIYFSFSASSSAYYSFDTDSGVWSAPLAVINDIKPNYGSYATYRQGKIYMIKGANTKKMSVYDIAGNTWTAGPDAPTEAYRAANFIKISDDYALYIPGNGKAAIWRFNYPSNINGNNAFGVYTSKNFLIEGVFDYVNIDATVDLPVNTSVEFQTRSTVDGTTWSDWQSTTEIKIVGNKIVSHIVSPVRKNIQVKAVLQSSDNFNKPTLYDFSVNYFADTSPPNNPTMVALYDNPQKTNEIIQNTWYKYNNPYIDWPDPGQAGGATDGLIGSNIAGYWVYFGFDSQAVPETNGQYVTVTEYSPTLVDPGLYYLKIQAVDGSGNVAATSYDAFLYKFDNEKPTRPAVISVDPAGYTVNNSFSFTWTASNDDFSGVKEYCYKTGASEGVYSQEQCQEASQLNLIPAAYQNGANVIYIRTKDYADNFSDSSTQTTFYWKDKDNPENLVVTNLGSVINGPNLFTFNWDLPLVYTGNADKMSYYYSVNALPVASNTVRVETRTTGAFAAATQPGTNTFYVVARDEASSLSDIDWTRYASINFSSNLVAPGIPVSLVGTDVSNRSINRWAVALTWGAPNNQGSGVDHYVVERSLDKLRFTKIATPEDTSYIDSSVLENNPYYYQIRAASADANTGGASSVVEVTPSGRYTSAPEIISGPEVAVGVNQATITWTTNRAASGFVYYGSILDQLIDSSGTISQDATHSVALRGLSPNAVYYYQIQNFDDARDYPLDQTFSTIRTFRTKPAATIQNVQVSDIKLNSVKISWTAASMVSYKINYGKTTQYGLNVTGDVTSENLSTILADLEDTTTYHFKIVSKTVDGDEVSSDDYQFSTLQFPVITNIKFQPVEGSSHDVIVSWHTNVPTTSIVSYQLGGSIKEAQDSSMVTEHAITLKNLAGNADYLVTPKGTDAYGNNAIGATQHWKTGLDTRPPVISNIKTQSILSADNSRAELVVSWETDETAASTAEYGLDKNYGDKTPLEASLSTRHVAVISDLKPAQIYHVRPSSVDGSGNIGYGEDTISVIGQRETNVVNVILKFIRNIFGWIKLGR